MILAAIETDADVERIGRGLVDRSLPKAEWTHAAHWAAAVWLLRCRPDIVPEHDMPAIIRAYNEATGGVNDDHNGYHETITLASLRAARAQLAACAANTPLHEVLRLLLASPLGRSDWPLAYWSHDRLFSVDARRNWAEPDLAPLTF